MWVFIINNNKSEFWRSPRVACPPRLVRVFCLARRNQGRDYRLALCFRYVQGEAIKHIASDMQKKKSEKPAPNHRIIPRALISDLLDLLNFRQGFNFIETGLGTYYHQKLTKKAKLTFLALAL